MILDVPEWPPGVVQESRLTEEVIRILIHQCQSVYSLEESKSRWN